MAPQAVRYLAPAVLVLSWGCGASERSTTTLSVSADERAGHQRMVDLLAGLKADIDKNPYLGRKQLRRLQELLAQADEGMLLQTRAKLYHEIGLGHLRLGENEEAVEHLETSRRLLDELPEDGLPPFAARLEYDLAVSYMRWGESQNCVARHTSQSCLLPIEGDGVHVDQSGSRTAIEHFHRALATAPVDSPQYLGAKWLLNVAYMTIGEYPDGVPDDVRIDPEVFASAVDFPRFVDVAPDRGINSFDNCGGAIAEDFDRDGHLDVLSSSWNVADELRLFLGAGDGTFVERTAEAGLSGIYGGLNLLQADYNNDGFADVFVLRGAWWNRHGEHPNSLLRNNGDGTFIDVTFVSGMGERFYPTQTAAWADYDNDGDLDLYVGGESRPTTPIPGQLFRNDGDGTFTDVAEEAGVENLGFAKAIVWGDYDDDRDPDLFVANLGGPNRLYRNLGDGTFEDVARELGVVHPVNAFTSWFWDYDNDADLDLYVASYFQGRSFESRDFLLSPVVASYLDLPPQAELACLYANDGRGGFREVTKDKGLGRLSTIMGANFGDLDNDGFPDFYLGTGYPYYDGLMPNVMYWNRRGESFVDVSANGGFGHLQKGHAVAFADFDEDGDQDVFMQLGGAYPGDAFGNALFENPGFGNHWLKVALVGTRSNRTGVGARIRIDVAEDGATRSIHHLVGTGGSFGGNPLTQHIGLGRATTVERLEVYWPTSDTTQTFRDVPLDASVVVVEGSDELRVDPPL